MNGYQSFALFYDLLQSDVDYDEIACYYDRILTKFGGKKSLTLDLACGTGKITRVFAELGYDMIAADASESMLAVATSMPNPDIQYICAGMTELDMFGTIDNAICVLDGINHLNGIDELRETFRRVSLFTNPSGLFVFDVNTLYKHEKILGDNTFIIERSELYTVWQNFYDGGGKICIELDFFKFNKKNGNYTRYTDSFSETAYKLDVIEKELKKAGFEVLACFDWLTENKPEKNSEKVVFTAKKI